MQNSDIDLVNIQFQLNGKPIRLSVRPFDSALAVIRDEIGLTGTKEGCGIGECGACTILVDGKAITACLMLAPQLDGREVQTIEGVAEGDTLHPVQQALLAHGAVQCGFCTPGMVMSAKGLLEANSHPTREEIADALAGNLCRCTGYVQIVDAIEELAGSPRANEAVKR
ncbi:MAG: (2Fe-2S)-binding protein [Desulfomonile sp.]|nr:(2Fe-2S)-binding protein [Desulfomonile sp.]